MKNAPLISCSGLEKTFSSAAEELSILKGVELEVEAGSTHSITGPSGSGKSTLLSILGGLDRATAGQVRVGPWELSALPERRLTEYRASFVGFVFQFHYLLKDFDALENVALPAYMAGLPREKALEKARALLAEVGLAERMGHFPSQLSGGERQRAALARALINDPPLLLADEPTGNLDAPNARKVSELLFELAPRKGTTLIVVTHDPVLAQAAGLRYELRDGILAPYQGGGVTA
jgi:lipoprotein-releasing system ATP-binding protein